MGQRYKQIDFEERCEIARLYAKGRSIRQIAATLDRSSSSIAREIKRNRGQQNGYQAGYANQQSRARRWAGSKLDRNHALRETVLSGLSRGWSRRDLPYKYAIIQLENCIMRYTKRTCMKKASGRVRLS